MATSVLCWYNKELNAIKFNFFSAPMTKNHIDFTCTVSIDDAESLRNKLNKLLEENS